MDNKKDRKIEQKTEQLAEEQKQERPEMHHLPTEGKAPEELKDFQKSLKNSDSGEKEEA